MALTMWNFALTYGAAAAAMLTAVSIRARMLDTSARRPLPPLPALPTPHRVAYLKGGDANLARCIVLDLADRGFLTLGEQEAAFHTTQFVQRAEDGPDPSFLNELERQVYDTISAPMLLDQLEDSADLAARLAPFSARLRDTLARDGLLLDEKQRAARAATAWIGIALLTIGWGAGFANALGRNQPEAAAPALIILLLAAYLLFGMNIWSQAPAITRRGKEWLALLQATYLPMHHNRDMYANTLAEERPLLLVLFS